MLGAKLWHILLLMLYSTSAEHNGKYRQQSEHSLLLAMLPHDQMFF